MTILSCLLPIFLAADLSSFSASNSIQSWSNKYKAQERYKDFINKENTAIKHSKDWLDLLAIDMLAKNNIGQKNLAELLGAYWMLHRYASPEEQKAIQKHSKPFYDLTFKKTYLQLKKQNDALFKKHSMSYLRVMWLLKEMHFDITHLLAYFKTSFDTIP